MIASSPASRAGWQAELALSFKRDAERTVIAHREHHGPLLIQRPFYPNPDECHVYIVHPPGGVVAGDCLRLRVDVAAEAHVLLTTPAAGKFYRRGAGFGGAADADEHGRAQVHQTFDVAAGTLEWLPQENIFYPGAVARLRTRIRLTDAARFFGWEVACFGLPARAAVFDSGEIMQGIELWNDGKPALIGRVAIDAACVSPRWGLAEHPVHGTLLALPATVDALQVVRAADCRDVSLSCTLLDKLLVCRALALRADRVRDCFADIWRRLRPGLLGREAVTPRIWAT